ncbi:unnamed protein product [Mytilus edulis]|uniref:Ig-like domain-containing protein n=1 Tax=Mytilus edulis TaxID=6550 RepID=A0A8S3QDE5_MYTED|nr:unnamed protein product [Mytilus edulis]
MWSEKLKPLQNNKQYDLRILMLLWFTTIYVCQFPGYPNITGSKLIVEGNSVTLTCTSSGAYPVPTVYWYRNVQLVDDTQTTTNCVTSNTYNFVADKSHNLAVFECQVDNNVLQNKLRTTWYFHVYTIPNQLTLNGSQTLSLGTTYQWACISTGGNPSPIMTLWIGNSQFSTGITQTSVLQSDKTYTVTSTLSWAPSVSNNGQTLYCDVKHQETRGYNMQTASLQLTVNDVPDVTITQPSQGSSGQAITIQCSYISNPKASHVKWSKGNQGITVDDYKYNGGSLSNPSLTIINLAASDQGSYRCSVVNSVGQGDSSYVTLSVDTSVSGPDAAVVVDDTSGLSSGEIVAIILAILFVLLSFLVVCCCCKGYCASLCGRKQEQVTQKSRT